MISSVLIANRGEVACRIARTCHRLGIGVVTIHSDADQEALHVRLGDQSLRVGPGPVGQSYLNLPAVLECIRQAKVDAVHPGYGLLSENAEFARSVVQRGVTFVGPSAEAMALLGDKLHVRELARSLGCDMAAASELIAVGQLDTAKAHARVIGFPLLVKAAAGGGGIGMIAVREPDELMPAIEKARTCAERAFGDARVYLERLLERPRHLEVQLARGRDGQVRILGERECSVQRRYQKVIEETLALDAPCLGVLGLRERMHQMGRALLEAANYVGVATAEFIVGEDNRPFLLEVNTRLQVEHTVTELVFQVDLVEWQLGLAGGTSLAEIAPRLDPSGHAIEARLYAEDPDRGYLPQPGRITALRWPEGEGLRIDTGVELGSELPMYYDPLIAKICAWASTRQQAIARLKDALTTLEVEVTGKLGPRVTNRLQLIQALSHPDFLALRYDTGLLGRL